MAVSVSGSGCDEVPSTHWFTQSERWGHGQECLDCAEVAFVAERNPCGDLHEYR